MMITLQMMWIYVLSLKLKQICLVLLVAFIVSFARKCEDEQRVTGNYKLCCIDFDTQDHRYSMLEYDVPFLPSPHSMPSHAGNSAFKARSDSKYNYNYMYSIIFALIISARISCTASMKTMHEEVTARDNHQSLSPSPSKHSPPSRQQFALYEYTKTAPSPSAILQHIQPIMMPGTGKGKQTKNDDRKSRGQSQRNGTNQNKPHAQQTGTYSHTVFPTNSNSVSSSGSGGDGNDDGDDGNRKRNNLQSNKCGTGSRRVKKKKNKSKALDKKENAVSIPFTKLTQDEEEDAQQMSTKCTLLNAKAASFVRSLTTIQENHTEDEDEQKHEPILLTKIYQTVHVSRLLTTKIIPALVDNVPSNVYSYMDKSMCIEHNKIYTEDGSVIVDFNFISKHNGERLYCMIVDSPKPGGLRWKMKDQLYTQKQLISVYGVEENAFQQFQDPRLQKEYTQEQLALRRWALVNTEQFLKQTKWTNVPIERPKKNNTKRHVLHMTKEKLIKELRHHIDTYGHGMRAIPVMLVKNNGKYEIEHVFLFRIDDDIWIGVGVQHFAVTRIYLRKQQIREAHELATAMDARRYHPHCLDEFVSTIDELCIGNPDEMQNKLKAKEQEIERLRQQLSSLSTSSSNSSTLTGASSISTSQSSLSNPPMPQLPESLNLPLPFPLYSVPTNWTFLPLLPTGNPVDVANVLGYNGMLGPQNSLPTKNNNTSYDSKQQPHNK